MNEKGITRTVIVDVAAKAAESTLSALGLLLLFFGSYGVFHAIVNSSIFYFALGIVLTFIFNLKLRRQFLQRLPAVLRRYLYSASLLDLAIEASSFMQALAALGFATILDKNDISRLAQALPAEYAFIAQPGVVHLMPQVLQNILLIESQETLRVETAPHDNDLARNVIGEAEELEVMQENGDEVEYELEVANMEEIDQGFFALPRRNIQMANLSTPSSNIHPAIRLTGRPVGIAVPRSNSSRLEDTIRQLGVEYISRWAVNAQGIVFSGMHYIASGGGCSTEQLLGTAVTLTVAGNACRTIVARRPPNSANGALWRVLDIASPVLIGLATTVSGMLVVRTFGGSVAKLYREGPWRVLSQRLRSLWQMRGFRGQELGMVVAISTVLILVAYRLRARLRELKWIASILIQQLRSGSAAAWALLSE